MNKFLPWLGLLFSIALFIGFYVLLDAYINTDIDVTEFCKCYKEGK